MTSNLPSSRSASESQSSSVLSGRFSGGKGGEMHPPLWRLGSNVFLRT